MAEKDIFERMRSGEAVPMNDPDYSKIREAVNRTFNLLAKLNTSSNVDEVRAILSEIIGTPVDESTTIFPPFHTNVGRHISLGKNVFINHACSFLDLGGIVIEDDVMIGPSVNMKLKITIGDTVLTATMYDNPTSRDFISMLPVTTTLEDYASTEKIFYPDRKLSTEGAPSGFDPSVGDITYYAPWGDIAIFYKDFGHASGLISLGKIDNNGIEQLRTLGGEEVTFELE